MCIILNPFYTKIYIQIQTKKLNWINNNEQTLLFGPLDSQGILTELNMESWKNVYLLTFVDFHAER